MTRLELLVNLNDIQDAYIDSAQKMLRNKIVAVKSNPGRRVFRRIFSGLIAAIIVLLSTFAVAMAASPEFREAVLSFFHISAADVTEHSPVEDQNLRIEGSSTQEQMSEIHVTVTRVMVPNNGHGANGLFRICTDEIEYNQGSHYDVYSQQGGELKKLELHSVNATKAFFGKTFHFDFEWASDGKNTAVGYLRPPAGGTDDAYYRLQFIPGHPYEMLVLLGNGDGGLYPMLMDLNTGKVTDFAAAIDMNAVGGINEWGYTVNGRLADLSLSEDMARLVFKNPEGITYYGDLNTGKLTDINALLGVELDGCSIAGDTALACFKQIGGGFDEKKAQEYAQAFDVYDGSVDFGSIRSWRIPLDTMQPELLGDVPATALSNYNAIWHGTELTEAITQGVVFPSPLVGQYMLEIDGERQVIVTDFATGQRSVIEGFTWPETPWPQIECQGSPCGDRLLISEYNEQGELFCLTVLDFSRLRWVTIDRENTAGGLEHWRTWFDNDRIMVDSVLISADGRSSGDSWYYLYDVSK